MDNRDKKISEVLKTSLRNKFKRYNPEPAVMPFHTRLLGKDRMALFSFIHSLNTNFGTTIFEPVAEVLAQNNFVEVEKQAKSGNFIYSDAQVVIQKIMDELGTATKKPDKQTEIEEIRKVCQSGKKIEVKPTKVDLKLVDSNGTVFLSDIKTAKPNKGGFKEFKRTLLEWVATTLAEDANANIHSFIAIPYNPYEPKPYQRWTMAGMLDLDKELKVASEFWNFLGGKGSYEMLLEVFEKVGIEMRKEIDDYFKKYLK